MALLLLTYLPAGAAASPSDAEAKAHFKRGTEAYRRAAYPEAIEEFEAANRLRPHGVLFFNIAQAHEKLGDLAAALRNYREYLRAIPSAEDRPVVEQAMTNLEKRLAERGVQQLAIYTQPAGATVQVDGGAAALSPYSAELSPGRHQVRITLEGFAVVQRQIDMPKDRSLQLDVTLPRTELEVEAAAPAVALEPDAATPRRPQTRDLPPASLPAAVANSQVSSGLNIPTATWVSAGVGGAALAGGVVLGLLAQSSRSALQSTTHDHETAQGLHDQAQSRALGADILFATAGSAAITAIVFYLLEPSQASNRGD